MYISRIIFYKSIEIILTFQPSHAICHVQRQIRYPLVVVLVVEEEAEEEEEVEVGVEAVEEDLPPVFLALQHHHLPHRIHILPHMT